MSSTTELVDVVKEKNREIELDRALKFWELRKMVLENLCNLAEAADEAHPEFIPLLMEVRFLVEKIESI